MALATSLAVAVLLDATIVRMVLGADTMALHGQRDWWKTSGRSRRQTRQSGQ